MRCTSLREVRIFRGVMSAVDSKDSVWCIFCARESMGQREKKIETERNRKRERS